MSPDSAINHQVDYDLLTKNLLFFGKQNAKSVIKNYTEESFFYQNELEDLVLLEKYEDIPRILSRLAKISRQLGGIDISNRCLKLINKFQKNDGTFTHFDIKELMHAKDNFISEMIRLKRGYFNLSSQLVN